MKRYVVLSVFLIISCKTKKEYIPDINHNFSNNVSIAVSNKTEETLNNLKNVEHKFTLDCFNNDSICDNKYNVSTEMRYDFTEKSKDLIFISRTDDYVVCSSCSNLSGGKTIFIIEKISIDNIEKIDTIATTQGALSRSSFNDIKENISLIIYPKYNSKSIKYDQTNVYKTKEKLKYTKIIDSTNNPIFFTLPKNYALFVKKELETLLEYNNK